MQPGRGQLAKAIMVDRAKNLGVQWTRLDMGFWRNIQPTRGAPYNVAELDRFEHDLAGALAANLTPIVVVIDSPAWATINRPYPTSCGAIRADRFADFAAFMGWLATRYKDRVQYWELGNEPDIDPTLVAVNQVFGCWGDINDPYYGGERPTPRRRSSSAASRCRDLRRPIQR